MATENALVKILDKITGPVAETVDDTRNGGLAHLRNLMADKNVVGVGIADKVSGGKATGILALTFYVKRKLPLSKLRGHKVIPPAIPESVDGQQAITTDVVVLGTLHPDKKANVVRNPIQPGNSIGEIDVTAGTLGAVVRKGKKSFLLSNSHVLADSGKAKKGAKILYPGKADGGKSPADVVGSLVEFVKFETGGQYVNKVDCAIASVDIGRIGELNSTVKGIGRPKGVAIVKRGDKIIKTGRTTGKTTGTVKDVHFKFSLTYEGVGSVGFTEQVLCSRYSQPGDSGALIFLNDGTFRTVGLHFASAEGGSVFSPIQSVLKALKVKL